MAGCSERLATFTPDASLPLPRGSLLSHGSFALFLGKRPHGHAIPARKLPIDNWHYTLNVSLLHVACNETVQLLMYKSGPMEI